MHMHDGGNKMTEVVQRSVESNQTADILDIARNSPIDKVQTCYTNIDIDIQTCIYMVPSQEQPLLWIAQISRTTGALKGKRRHRHNEQN